MIKTNQSSTLDLFECRFVDLKLIHKDYVGFVFIISVLKIYFYNRITTFYNLLSQDNKD